MRDFTALLGFWALAIGATVYILEHQLGVRLPLVDPAPFQVKMEVDDAQGVAPGQGQPVQVAGVTVGYIGAAELDDGHALLTLDLEPKYEGLLREDATALMRSRTPLRDVLVEVAPGRGEPLEEGETIRLSNSAPEVDLDQIWAAFDADTRSYLKLLITGTGAGTRGRGNDLSQAFRRLAPLHADIARVARAIARRRESTQRLVNRYGLLTTTLARSRNDITRLVRATDATFGAFAERRGDLASAVRQLPAALRETEAALAGVDALSRRLPPALVALRPAVRELEPAMRALLPLATAATPVIRDRLRPLTRLAASELELLGAGSSDLARGAGDTGDSVARVNRLLNMFAFNPGGAEELEGTFDEQRSRQEGLLWSLAHTIQAGGSVFSSANGMGAYRRAFFTGTDCSVFGAQGLPRGVVDLLGEAGLCGKSVPTDDP